jgi:hypothetical protein
LSSTATDLARFITAHLQDGQFGDVHILKPETARLMHSRLFALADAANAMAYGFYEESRNGHRIIGHAGDTQYFHSDSHLVLDAGVGFFVSYNSAGKGGASPRTVLWESFLDRYFPATLPSEQTLASASQDAKTVSGKYMLSRRGEASFLKTASLVSQMTVAPAENGSIEVAELTGANGQPKRWREVAPMTFLEEGGWDKLVFKPDANGRMQLILPYPFFIGQRVGVLENSKLIVPVILFSLGIMLLTLLLWPITWFVRRHYGHRLDLTGMEWLLRVLVRIDFLLIVVFAISIIGLVTYGLEHLWVFSDAGNKYFLITQIIGIVGAVGTLVVLLNAIQTWTSKRTRIWMKLQATIFVLACLGFLWFALAGNLLRLHFPLLMNTLPRTLGLRDVIFLTIGSVIGSGIFLVPGSVVRTSGRIHWTSTRSLVSRRCALVAGSADLQRTRRDETGSRRHLRLHSGMLRCVSGVPVWLDTLLCD